MLRTTIRTNTKAQIKLPLWFASGRGRRSGGTGPGVRGPLSRPQRADTQILINAMSAHSAGGSSSPGGTRKLFSPDKFADTGRRRSMPLSCCAMRTGCALASHTVPWGQQRLWRFPPKVTALWSNGCPRNEGVGSLFNDTFLEQFVEVDQRDVNRRAVGPLALLSTTSAPFESAQVILASSTRVSLGSVQAPLRGAQAPLSSPRDLLGSAKALLGAPRRLLGASWERAGASWECQARPSQSCCFDCQSVPML